MQSAFSNVILYMSVGLLLALAALLTFIRLSLKKGGRDIEESAKKHGIASHAGLYVSMHLLDLKNDMIYELSKDPNVQLLLVSDGRDAAAPCSVCSTPTSSSRSTTPTVTTPATR